MASIALVVQAAHDEFDLDELVRSCYPIVFA